MKSVALSGTRGHVPGVPFMSTDLAMQRVGNNCGNLVFQYAVTNLIEEDTKVVGQELSWNPDGLSKTSRVVVVPSANFLREGADFSVFTDFLERADLPLVFIGLGAQADDYNKKEFDFHPSVVRMIDLMRERTPKISIRGEFTARVLERFGITNFEVTGCPSNFINPAPDFAEQIQRKLDRPMRTFITHAEEPWPKKKFKKEVERRLVSWTQDGPGIMVQQSVPGMMKYLRQNNPFAENLPGENFENNLAKALMPEADIEQFREFIALKLRTYYSVDQWIEDSSKFDFSVGMRLHGNMTAWQSGTPALWITHDARTQELSETMALPHIHVDDFLENCHSITDAWERFEFDPKAYTERRGLLRERLNSVFNAAGINSNLQMPSKNSVFEDAGINSNLHTPSKSG